LAVLLVIVALLLVVAIAVAVSGMYMMVAVPLCVGRESGNGISNVKVKSRNELVLGRVIPPDIREQSFLVQIRHGSGNKTLSYHDRVYHATKENRATPAMAVRGPPIHRE
jgi:hypothetical protein